MGQKGLERFRADVACHEPYRATGDAEMTDDTLILQFDERGYRPVRRHRRLERDPLRVVEEQEREVTQTQALATLLYRAPNPRPRKVPGVVGVHFGRDDHPIRQASPLPEYLTDQALAVHLPHSHWKCRGA